MELAGETSLSKYLKSKLNRKVQECDAKRIFKQLVSAVNFCHSMNITHRDIKLDNILID